MVTIFGVKYYGLVWGHLICQKCGFGMTGCFEESNQVIDALSAIGV